jgi:hypothetical protein
LFTQKLDLWTAFGYTGFWVYGLFGSGAFGYTGLSVVTPKGRGRKVKCKAVYASPFSSSTGNV